MAVGTEPVLHNWYRRRDVNQTLQVTAIESGDSVSVQYAGGNVDTFDRAEWARLDLERVEGPDDFAAPLDRQQAP